MLLHEAHDQVGHRPRVSGVGEDRVVPALLDDRHVTVAASRLVGSDEVVIHQQLVRVHVDRDLRGDDQPGGPYRVRSPS